MKSIILASLAALAAACPEGTASDWASAKMARSADNAGNLNGYFDHYVNYTRFPNAQKENVTRYLVEAKELAGVDLYPFFSHVCTGKPVYTALDRLAQSDGFVAPMEVFRGLFFVGQAHWSAWAYDTGDGLVLYDTMLSGEEIAGIVIPALEGFGYTGHDIRYAIVSHEHLDHYGGARYLQEQYQTPILASEVAWQAMTKTDPEAGPIRDERSGVITEGMELTVGDLTTTFYETPGHTDGTISWIFPVTDKQTGETWLAGYYGGSAPSSTAVSLAQQAVSLDRFGDLAAEKGVEVLIGNHQSRDRSLYHMDLLQHRVCDDGKTCNMPNPYVMGVDKYRRWCQLNALCIRAYAARMGFVLQE